MSEELEQNDTNHSSPLTFDEFKVVFKGTFHQSSTKATSSSIDNFIKSIKISPDGTRLLSTSEDCKVDVYSIDERVLAKSSYYGVMPDAHSEPDTGNLDHSTISTLRTIRPGESIYDFDWYPRATLSDSSSQCFITTCRDKPVQLYGVEDGLLRCSYCIHNTVCLDSMTTFPTHNITVALPNNAVGSARASYLPKFQCTRKQDLLRFY
jgi:WD40 repeat protein